MPGEVGPVGVQFGDLVNRSSDSVPATRVWASLPPLPLAAVQRRRRPLQHPAGHVRRFPHLPVAQRGDRLDLLGELGRPDVHAPPARSRTTRPGSAARPGAASATGTAPAACSGATTCTGAGGVSTKALLVAAAAAGPAGAALDPRSRSVINELLRSGRHRCPARVGRWPSRSTTHRRSEPSTRRPGRLRCTATSRVPQPDGHGAVRGRPPSTPTGRSDDEGVSDGPDQPEDRRRNRFRRGDVHQHHRRHGRQRRAADHRGRLRGAVELDRDGEHRLPGRGSGGHPGGRLAR